MNKFACYRLEGLYYKRDYEDDPGGAWTIISGPDGGWDPFYVYWATEPSPNQITVGALRLLEKMNRSYSLPTYVGSSHVRIEWEMVADAPMGEMLEAMSQTQPILEEYAAPLVGHVSSPESIWPYVVGAAVLFG